MLAFENQEHFDEVLGALTAEQIARDEITSPGTFRENDILLGFADELGFESLLSYIDFIESELENQREVPLGIYNPLEPSSHHIISPFRRALVNPQSEVMVGSTIYRYYTNGYHKILNRNMEMLDFIRLGEDVNEHPDVIFHEYQTMSGPCCHKNNTIIKYKEYAGGERRLKATQWIFGTGNYGGEIGVVTENQRKKNNGQWTKSWADTIGHYGASRSSEKSCLGPSDHHGYNKERHGRKSITDVHEGRKGWPLYATEYFVSKHYVEDLGDSASIDLAMCVCEQAQASFTLPSSSSTSASIHLDGSESTQEIRYFVEIHPIGTSIYWNKWFFGEVGKVNLATYFNFSDPGGTGTTYSVKLAVQNSCTPWNEQVKNITIYGDTPEVTYSAHVQKLSWMKWAWDGGVAGTTGQSRRMEAVRIKLANQPAGMKVCYQAFVSSLGWQEPSVCDGEVAGTTGQSRRMQKIKIWLENAPGGCKVQYKAYTATNESSSWGPWVADGQVAGNYGSIQALRVRLVDCP